MAAIDPNKCKNKKKKKCIHLYQHIFKNLKAMSKQFSCFFIANKIEKKKKTPKKTLSNMMQRKMLQRGKASQKIKIMLNYKNMLKKGKLKAKDTRNI